jgi:hypothetical protein
MPPRPASLAIVKLINSNIYRNIPKVSLSATTLPYCRNFFSFVFIMTKRADLVQISLRIGVPVVRRVWREGIRVLCY